MAVDVDGRGAIEQVLALKALHDFAAVHPDDLAVLALRATPRRFGAEDALAANAEGRSVHFLLDGRVRGAPAARSLEAPAMLGLVDVLAGAGAPPLVAEVASSTLAIDRGALLAVLEDEFELWLAVFHCVARSAVAAGCRFGRDGAQHAGASKADLSDLAEGIATLRRIPPFDDMRTHLLGQIAAELKPFAIAAGQPLWSPGAAASHAILVTEGFVACEGGPDAGEFGAGTIAGFADALTGDRHGHRSVARTAVRGLQLETETLIDLLEDDPGGAVEWLCGVARRAFERRSVVDAEHRDPL